MKSNYLFIFCSFLLFSLTKCGQKKTNETRGEESEIIEDGPLSYGLEKSWSTDSLFKTPESVVYDKDRDVLYVSNVNENPWEKDGNGFVSKLSTSGEILDLEWVKGLSGPKGMAIVGNTLFAADLDEIALIDIEKGEIVEMVKIEGASGLNDITPDNEGGIFISDSNEGKIYHYSEGEVSVFNDDTPGRPNGVFVDNGKLFVAFSKGSEFVSFDLGNNERTLIASGIGAGDGITPTNEDDTYLVSDWNGEVFVIMPDGNKTSLLMTKDQKKNTADIWTIPEMNLVLVPTFFDNRVEAYTLVAE